MFAASPARQGPDLRCKSARVGVFVFFLAGRQGSVKGTVLLRKIRYGLIAVSPGLLRKLFWRVTFAWRGKSHQNRAEKTRLFRRTDWQWGLNGDTVCGFVMARSLDWVVSDTYGVARSSSSRLCS